MSPTDSNRALLLDAKCPYCGRNYVGSLTVPVDYRCDSDDCPFLNGPPLKTFRVNVRFVEDAQIEVKAVDRDHLAARLEDLGSIEMGEPVLPEDMDYIPLHDSGGGAIQTKESDIKEAEEIE